MSFAGNPKANQPHPSEAPQESTGAVAKDSLAAESMKSGGAFSENENAAVMAVSGSNSTLNTTDTSGATALPPAIDGNERERQQAKGAGSDEKGVTGLKLESAGKAEFSGTHDQEGYSGGPTSTSSAPKTTQGGLPSGATGDSFADGGAGLTSSSSGNTSEISSGPQSSSQVSAQKSSASGSSTSAGTTSGSAGSAGSSGNTGNTGSSAGTAPNYAATVSGAIRSEGEQKPKGQNLTEGDIPQTKTFTGDVGGQHDPGRVAEQTFNKTSAEGVAAAGNLQHPGSGADVSTDNKFDVLDAERVPNTSMPDRN
ncbi:hypothetical protein LTS08_004157 [Lithohypha guttulata]|uniref:Uncharacterized protein n=1 Tax=Lithohypha guttulata TaxID=1690604 RepID=A0AAN7YHL7_9EURO|nr:hypothetical protein LTR05_003702 [Lithohypha guttulata]KAK5101698.1 hypothetical protein LTS08_004157 [Lithohypha guttulata]